MLMFPLVAALGIATAPAVDLNAFPTEMASVEFPTTHAELVDHPYVLMPIAFEHYNGMTVALTPCEKCD